MTSTRPSMLTFSVARRILRMMNHPTISRRSTSSSGRTNTHYYYQKLYQHQPSALVEIPRCIYSRTFFNNETGQSSKRYVATVSNINHRHHRTTHISISRLSTTMINQSSAVPNNTSADGNVDSILLERDEPIISSSSSSSFSSTENRKNRMHKSKDTKQNMFHPNNQTHDSMMELYDILMSKQIGAFRFPTDYNVYAISFIRYVIHLNTTSFYGNVMNQTNHINSNSNSNTNMKNEKNANDDDDLPNIATSTNTTSTRINGEQQQRDREAITAVINAAFRLWERTTYEYSLRRFNNADSRVESTTSDSSSANITSSNNNDHILWLHSSRIFDKLMMKWKMVALSSIRTIGPKSTTNNPLISPMDVLQTVQTISKHNKSIDSIVQVFDKDISVYNTILQVLLAKHQKISCYTAPIHIDKFIHQYLIRPAAATMSQQEQQHPTRQSPPSSYQQPQPSASKYEPLSHSAIDFNRKNTDPVYNKIYKASSTATTVLKPNIFTYTILLRAWIQSEHPMSLQEIEYIMATIQDIYWYEKNVVPNLNNSSNAEENMNKQRTPTKGSAQMDILTPHMLAIRFYANLGDVKEVDMIFNYVQKVDDLPTNDQYGLFLAEMIHSYCMRSVVTKNNITLQYKHLAQAEDLFHILVNQVINEKFDSTTRKFTPVPLDHYTPDTIKAVMTSANSIMNSFRWLLRPIKKQVIIVSRKQDDDEGDGVVNNGNDDDSGIIRNKASSLNEEMISRAEKFLEQIEKFEQLDSESFAKLRLPLMDMYARMHKLQKAESMFEKYRDGDDNHPHAILIKAFSNCNQPERAERLVQSMLQSEKQRSMVDIEVINCLLCAWAECSTSNKTVAADRAHQIYRWIYDHPICMQLKLRPNFDTYSLLFDCMAKAGSIRSFNDNDVNNPRNKIITSGIASKVESLLNEIENRYLTGGDANCRPDVILYNCAIQACLNCKEYDQAEYILQLMEHRMAAQQQTPSDTQKVRVVPDLRTYCLLLNCYSKLGTDIGAEWTEQLHNHMRKLALAGNHLLKPTVSTYNIVLSGWAASGATNLTDRIWKVYEQMTHVDEIELDEYNYTTLISALSKSKTSNGIQRAIELLQIMQTKAKSVPSQSKIHPDGRHYCVVLKACVDVDDVDNAAYVMNMYIDSYLMQRCRPSDHPDRSIFHWIVTSWITRNELTLASWFMFDTVTAVMKANNIPMNNNNSNGTPPNMPFATPAISRVMKTIGVDPAITSRLRSAWRESLQPQHLTEKERYLTKIKKMITVPLFESQRQDYHKRFQSPNATSDSDTSRSMEDETDM